VVAPQTVVPQDIIEPHGSKGLSDRATGGNRVLVFDVAVAAGAAAQVTTDGGSSAPEVLPEGDTSVTMEEAAVGDPTASTGPAGGASPPLQRLTTTSSWRILGHPTLRALGDVSLDEAMGTTRCALTQAQNVLHRESGGIIDERQCLLLWSSMLKERTTTERVRAEAR
jgi:hypothetical protein